MIYFFNNDLELEKVVTSSNVDSAIHEHELNGLIIFNLEIDLEYGKTFIDRVDHVGYYYKDEFYLHKIERVEDLHTEELMHVFGRHIFFNDMVFGRLVEDIRPQNRDALYVLTNSIDLYTRWQTVMTDTTGTLSTNFYWQVPYEVIEFVVKNYRVEYVPKILFDGMNINGFQLHVANRIGEDKSIRVPFGSRVLELSYEIDYSEIITRLVVHGKGEEVGDGYGRRINIKNVDWNKDGVRSPLGDLYLEDESLTAEYGNDNGRPRYGREVFEDIDTINELAQAGHDLYQEVSRPRMLFSASVSDIGPVDIGDSISIIRRDRNVYFKARIHKMTVDLMYPEDAEVELGDYEHFNESKAERSQRQKTEQWRRQSTSLITQMKNDFNQRFDDVKAQFKSELEQAIIDANAEVAAAEQRMTEELAAQRATMIENIESAEQAAKDAAAQNLADTTERINTTIDTNRVELSSDIQNAKQEAIEQAEADAKAKADNVQNNLDSFKDVHQQLYDSVKADVLDIDEFLGDIRNITLDERLQEINLDFEDRINNININTANMLQGTRFDEPTKINTSFGGAEILTTGDINRMRIRDDTGYVSRFAFEEPVKLEANTDYFVTIEYRTFTVPEIDYFAIETPTGYVRLYSPDTGKEGFTNLVTDGVWNQATIRLNEPVMRQGKLHIGTRPSGDNNGVWIDIRQPYMTNTSNRRWLPHPNDSTQSIEQIVRRVTELEDGREELITRSEYDFDTGKVDQTIREIEEKVDISRNMIVDIENYEVIKNGSEILQTVDMVGSKVWMNDVANIGANLLPQSSGAWEDGGLYIASGNESPNTNNIRMIENRTVKSSTKYTISDYSTYVSAIAYIDIHEYTGIGTWLRYHRIPRGGEKTFTTHWNTTNVRVSLLAMDGFAVGTNFIEHLDGRIKVKLEEGSQATPMVNAISHLQQTADKISLKVQELSSSDGEDILTQSDISVKADRVLIGSQSIGASTLASIISVSPSAVDIITDKMNLTGNLNVKGQIESISMSAVKAEFASLFAEQVRAGKIDVDYINGLTAEFQRMYTLNANIERLVAQHVFTDAVHAKSLDAIEANFGRVQTAILKSNVITSDMIGSNVIRAEHIFVQNAMIEDIVATHVFTDNVKAMSIDAVYANISSIRSRILTSDVILSEHVNASMAIIDKLFSHSAYIERLTSKSAFIRDINAIEIQANSLILKTMMNRFGQVEGGQRILGYDGRVVVNNGILQKSFDIGFVQPGFMSEGVYTSANFYRTNNTSYSNIAAFSYQQASRYLVIKGYVTMRANTAGASGNTVGAIRLMEFSGGSSSSFVYIKSRNETGGDNQYFTIELDLGVPDYRQRNFYIQIYTANSETDALARINQAYQYH